MQKNHKSFAAVAVVVVGFCSINLHAAVKVPNQPLKQEKVVSMELTIMALRLPYDNRIAALRAQGPKTIENLKALAINKKESLNNRWKALISYGELVGVNSIAFLRPFLSSKEWYMRAAALHASQFADRKLALEWSSQLLNDPALMVRSSAVQVIDKLEGKELSNLLWEKLYAAENFYRGRSLWIRQNILEILAKYSQPKDAPRYLRILNQEDKSLHPIGVKALTKITGIAVDTKKFPSMDDQKQAWSDWAANIHEL